MKSRMLIMMTIFMLGACQSQAQTFAEWWQQKKTQKKYLIQQIALFQTYLGYVKKGYSIARDGTNLIHSITDGEFSLHEAFFGSLSTVNPAVKKYARVADIIRGQANVISLYHSALSTAKGGNFSPARVKYFQEVFNGLLSETEAIVGDVIKVVTDKQLTMRDDERLNQIDILWSRSREQQLACWQLARQISSVDAAMTRDKSDLEASQIIYGLKKIE